MSGSSPGWTSGFVPTPDEWNSEFALKADYSQLSSVSGTATNALSTANNALTVADAAQTTAASALTLASGAQPAIAADAGDLLGAPGTLGGTLTPITVGSFLQLSSGTLSALAQPISVSDEGTTLPSATSFFFQNPGLSVEQLEEAPVIVQKAYVDGSGNLTFPHPVTVGNYVAVFTAEGGNISAPASYMTAVQNSTFNEGVSFIYGGIATTTTAPSFNVNPLDGGASGGAVMLELSGVTSVTSGQPQNSSNSETQVYTLGVVASTPCLMYATVLSQLTTLGGLAAIGATIDHVFDTGLRSRNAAMLLADYFVNGEQEIQLTFPSAPGTTGLIWAQFFGGTETSSTASIVVTPAIKASYLGLPTASEVIWAEVLSQPKTLTAGLPGAYAACLVAPTASYTLTINHNGSSIGTIVFAASATTATFTFAGAVNMVAGDTFTISSPATPDATFSGFMFSTP